MAQPPSADETIYAAPATLSANTEYVSFATTLDWMIYTRYGSNRRGDLAPGVNYFAQSDMTVLRWLCIDSVIACQCPFKSF